MAFIVEDGTGLENANSFIDVAYLDSYCQERQIDISTLTTDDKQSLLIKATDFINTVYYGYFQGVTLNETQSLEFPRIIGDDTIYPLNLKKATAEMALKATDGVLLEDSNNVIKREKLDVIETEYDTNFSQQKKYTFVYNLLRPYMMGSQTSKKILRG